MCQTRKKLDTFTINAPLYVRKPFQILFLQYSNDSTLEASDKVLQSLQLSAAWMIFQQFWDVNGAKRQAPLFLSRALCNHSLNWKKPEGKNDSAFRQALVFVSQLMAAKNLWLLLCCLTRAWIPVVPFSTEDKAQMIWKRGGTSVSFSHFLQSAAIIAFLTGNKSRPSGLAGSRIFNRNVAGLPVVPLRMAA